MKKSTMQSLVNYLNGATIDNLEELKAELEAELNRNAEKSAAKAAEYEAAKPIVVEAMRVIGKSATAAEIFAEAEKELPEGFTKNRMQYGLTHYWTDVITSANGEKSKEYTLIA